jgi:dihydrofolate reductase
MGDVDLRRGGRRPQQIPPKQDEHLTFTFVTDGLGSAVEQAEAAAGEKAVQAVGGPSLIQSLLGEGLVDHLRIDVMPVVLGHGLRLLDNVDRDRVRLEKAQVEEVGQRTSLGFRVDRTTSS